MFGLLFVKERFGERRGLEEYCFCVLVFAVVDAVPKVEFLSPLISLSISLYPSSVSITSPHSPLISPAPSPFKTPLDNLASDGDNGTFTVPLHLLER